MYDPEATQPPLPKPGTAGLPDYAREIMDHLEPGKRLDELRADHIKAIRANYYGKISLVDHWCGEIFEAYRRRGWYDDLLIVFLSDHGEMLGDHARLFKNTFHEQGIRVPLILRWPGTKPAGGTYDGLTELTDVMPTLLDLLGLPVPDTCVGRTLQPVLEAPDRVHRTDVLSEVAFAGRRTAMVRTECAKYALDDQGRGYMLYDLNTDPGEQNNLIARPESREMEAELRDLLLRRLLQAQYEVGNEHLEP